LPRCTAYAAGRQGDIVTLIGGNGAGKTTTPAGVSGLIKPRSGEIRYAGQALLAPPAHHS